MSENMTSDGSGHVLSPLDGSVERQDECPMGCGRLTEDIYGGPCNICWDAAGQATTYHKDDDVMSENMTGPDPLSGFQRREILRQELEREKARRRQLEAELADMTAERNVLLRTPEDSAEARIARVLDLHREAPESAAGFCRACGTSWPCATVRSVTERPHLFEAEPGDSYCRWCGCNRLTHDESESEK